MDLARRKKFGRLTVRSDETISALVNHTGMPQANDGNDGARLRVGGSVPA